MHAGLAALHADAKESPALGQLLQTRVEDMEQRLCTLEECASSQIPDQPEPPLFASTELSALDTCLGTACVNTAATEVPWVASGQALADSHTGMHTTSALAQLEARVAQLEVHNSAAAVRAQDDSEWLRTDALQQNFIDMDSSSELDAPGSPLRGAASCISSTAHTEQQEPWQLSSHTEVPKGCDSTSDSATDFKRTTGVLQSPSCSAQDELEGGAVEITRTTSRLDSRDDGNVWAVGGSASDARDPLGLPDLPAPAGTCSR